jgi:ubiquinone/menaquinone biosynthesis C-methylase UbiE
LFEGAVRPYLDSADGQADLQALETVREQRRERSRKAHDRLAESWEQDSGFLTGTLRAEAVAALVPRRLTVADLGCGAGFLSLFLAERGAHVIAIDHSEKMLEQARRRTGPGAEGVGPDSDTIEFRAGDLEKLPLQDCEVDAAFANLVWHHLADMDQAAREVFRALRPGGTVVVTDLLPHDEEWMRDQLGDLRLGLKADLVLAALARAGFQELGTYDLHDRHVVEGPRERRAELSMFLVRGVRPLDDRVFAAMPIQRSNEKDEGGRD